MIYHTKIVKISQEEEHLGNFDITTNNTECLIIEKFVSKAIELIKPCIHITHDLSVNALCDHNRYR